MDSFTKFTFPNKVKNAVHLSWNTENSQNSQNSQNSLEFSVPNVSFTKWLEFDAKEIISNSQNSVQKQKFSQWMWSQYKITPNEPWKNRLIHTDSLLGMAALLSEGNAGKVQMIYCDPPFGISYHGKLSRDQTVVEGYVDNWQQGLADYLDHLKKRFFLCHLLLNESGSMFVQIGEDNLHYVRCIMDEIFGKENCLSVITFRTAISTNNVFNICDYLLWYAKDKSKVFRRPLYLDRPPEKAESTFTYADSDAEKNFKPQEIVKRISGTKKQPNVQTFTYNSQKFTPPLGFEWKWSTKEMEQLATSNRLTIINNKLYGKRYPDDFSMMLLTNVWTDTATSTFAAKKHYTVHTNPKVIRRCLAMTTKPGDLVLDPTCGSGTTPWVAEEMGRRWIAFDTSPRAIMGTFSWLLGSIFSEYRWNVDHSDFFYKSLTKLSLSDLAHERESVNLSLFDTPEENSKLQRVASPFIVELVNSSTETKIDFVSWENLFPQQMARSGILLPNGDIWKIKPQSLKYLKKIQPFHLFASDASENTSNLIFIIGPSACLDNYNSFADLLTEISIAKTSLKDLQIYFFSGLLPIEIFRQLKHQISERGFADHFHFIWIHPEIFCEGLSIESHADLFRLSGEKDKFFNPITQRFEAISNEKIAVHISFSNSNSTTVQSIWLGFFENFLNKDLKLYYSERITKLPNMNSLTFDHQGTLHYGVKL